MIQAYRRELDMLKDIEINLLRDQLPIFQEEDKVETNILPFEDENEFYYCAEPWDIK